MDADGFAGGQQFVQAVDTLRVAHGQLVHHVVEPDPHPEGFGQHGKLRPDVAVSDQSEGAATDLVGAAGRLIPDALMHLLVLVGQMASQRHDLCQGQLDDTAGVAVGSVEAGDTQPGGRVQVDLVGADAECAHGLELGGTRQDPLGELGTRTDAEQRHAFQGIDQVVLAEGAATVLDLVAGIGQQSGGLRMDVLKQQGFHDEAFYGAGPPGPQVVLGNRGTLASSRWV